MGIIDNEIIIDGVSTKDFHIYCSGVGSFSSPERQYDKVEIPGKNGVVYRDRKSYSNVEVVYKCLIYGDIEDFDRFRTYVNSKVGYFRLEDSFHPDEYRMAILTDPISPKMKSDDMASFKLEFDCMPQRFLKDGEKSYTITTSGQLMNNTLFEAKPLIKVTESGSLTINGKTLTFTNIQSETIIDCEEMDCYAGSTNMNRYVSGEFPTLKSGINQIACSGTIVIIPRWWTL